MAVGRLAELRAANPATATKARLEREQARTATAISRLLEAYQEQLLSLDELRGRMPALRAKQHTLAAQLDALQAQLVDQQTTLKLAEDLESFLGRLRDSTTTASVPERQRVLRLLVKEVLIGPDRVVIRHRIPVTSPEPAPGHLLRGRSRHPSYGASTYGASTTGSLVVPPSGPACRARPVWQSQTVPALSGLLPPFPAPPGSGCPQLHRPAATGQRRRSFTSARINSASRRTASSRYNASLSVSGTTYARMPLCRAVCRG